MFLNEHANCVAVSRPGGTLKIDNQWYQVKFTSECSKSAKKSSKKSVEACYRFKAGISGTVSDAIFLNFLFD